MTAGPVPVTSLHGTVAELHGIDPFDGAPIVEPQVWWCEPSDAAIVLGSRQRPDVLDAVACERAGLGVVRRRSGGGAVAIRPGGVVWIDLVLPADLVSTDVRESMEQVGEWWLAAIAPDVPAGAVPTVHRGPMSASPWSELVCFAGVGPGEVLLAGRKLVGLSQRRTRFGLRVQGLVYRSPTTAVIGSLFAAGAPLPVSDLDEPAWLPDVDAAAIATRLAVVIGSQRS